jgi:two-component system response regulator MprA
LLRRARDDGSDRLVLTIDDLWLDLRTYHASRRGRVFALLHTECKLLELFLRNPRQVLARELIEDRVWGDERRPNSNSLEVHVGLLRRKTEAGGEPRMIHTVRGIGYVLRGS